VVVPLSLYKEMVCYLRVLLESGLEGHHEIAIAALHRLFYASAERLDPLPKLLSAWKSGTYPRRHLHVLVELVHETLKTLEAAQLRFRPEGDKNAEEWARKKYKRKGGKNEMDLEQYVMACMRFKSDDYFKRIVTNQTVRMYTKLLSHYSQNDATTNYFAYCFLRRMNAFALEQDVKTPSALKLPGVSTSDSQEEEVSLGFMLFNIQTLDVFNKIINDRDVYDNKAMEPLLRLVKSIVRRFGQAAAKNHMLFVELLFQHPRPHEFCCTLDSVYEAPAHAAYVNATHTKRRDGLSGGGDDDQSGSDSASDSSSDEDFGDEFDENNVSEAFKATISEKQKARLAKQQAREDRKKDKASRQARKEQKRAKAAAQMAERLAPRASRFAWMPEEDEILKTQYALYAGTRSVFTKNPELK
jgi:timeless